MVDLQGLRTPTPTPGPRTPGTEQAQSQYMRSQPTRVNGGNGSLVKDKRLPEIAAILSNNNTISWEKRKIRMDKAIAWLRSEMELLRIYDKFLIAKFEQVQIRIDSIKKERELARHSRRCASEEPFSEEEAWEDWEITEFEESFAEEYGYSLDSRTKRVSKQAMDARRLQRHNNGLRMTVPRKDVEISV